MKDNREFDDNGEDRRFFSKENDVDENEIFEESKRILQEIEDELLSDVECENLVKEVADELCNDPFGESLFPRDTKRIQSPQCRESRDQQEWEVDMWNPQIRGTPVDSEKQVMSLLRNIMPGLLKHQNFARFKDQISIHLHATQEFGHRSMVSYREIDDFCTLHNYPSTTVESWVLQKVQPSSFRVINENAVTRGDAEKVVSEIRGQLGELTSQAKLDEYLDTPYHEQRTKTSPNFKRDYEKACGFYRFLGMFAEGGVLSDTARRAGIKRLEARAYVEEKTTPRMIRKVLNRPLDEIEAIKARPLIKDMVQYEQLLSRQPHTVDIDGFSDMDRHMRAYLKVREMQRSDSLPDIPLEELAESLHISGSRLNLYLSGKSAPQIQSTLLLHEDLRLEYEGKLPSLAFENRIEHELVFKELHHLKDSETIDVDSLASSLKKIYENTDISSKVRWLDLHRYAPTGQGWFKGVVDFCGNNQSEIEHALNQQLGFDKDTPQRLRLGIISSRVYLRLENIR
ncbi:MAG: hypothetical protein E4H14_12955, partial [Candidatus Thorarchaeota archaeon]